METTDFQTPVILIVDDNHKNLQVLGQLLKEANYEVEFAPNGESALDWVYNKPFDLVLLDINMPGMNGFEVCKKIRSDPKMDTMSIIFLSADSDRESILQGFDLGGQDYITKPFDSRELLVRAKTHIKLKRSIEKFETLSQHLEEKVNERTHQLEEANTELIIAKDKAEESDRLKSAFLANMSHEIRTPMNGILGFTGLLKEADLTGEEQQRYISIIEKSGDRLLNIITNIVTYSSIEAGAVEIKPSETNINEQLEHIYSLFLPQAEQKGIPLTCTKRLAENHATINTDHNKIYVILTNLIKNAINFTTSGSIEFGCERKGKFLEFFVKDTGIGIAEDQKAIIFSRFRQGSEELTRTHEGAGLGLCIAKGYVEILGGKIWVESEIGIGSTFRFTVEYPPEL
jgi:signal transduction histidine kinase